MDNLQDKFKIIYPSNNDVDWEKFAIDNTRKEFLYDIVQKIVYTVRDLNNEYIYTKESTMKDIIYRISLVRWISRSMYLLRTSIKKEIIKGFRFDEEDELRKAKDYLDALRSFAVAHPLDTSDHAKFSLDGSKICVDIRTREMVESVFGVGKIEAKRFSFDGIKASTDVQSGDYYLYIYSSEDDFNMGEFIACYLDDLYETAQLYINKLCALEQFLIGLNEVTNEQTGTVN